MKMRILAILGIALASVLSTGCMKVVDPGDRAVEVKLGEVSQDVVQPGLIFPYNPFTTDYEVMNVQVQKYQDQTAVYTKDVQLADVQYAINFRLDPAAVVTTYTDVGLDWADKLLPQVVLDNLKSGLGSYDAETLIGKRDEARALIQTKLTAALAPKGIIVTSFEINNIDYSDAFENSVEAKVVAAQNALAEENRTRQNIEKNKQVLNNAETQAESLRIQGAAVSNNPKVVELERIKMLQEVGIEMAKNKAYPQTVTIMGSGTDNLSMLLGVPTK